MASSFQRVVERYIVGNYDAMRRICEPLQRFFGINYFTYHHIDNDGMYRVLVSRPDWAEHYVANEYYMRDPYLRHPSCFESSGVLFWPALASDHYARTVLKAGREGFDMDHGLLMVDKRPDGCHFYGFTTRRHNAAIYQLYLNERSLLRAFITHFHREAAPILKRVYEDPIDLGSIKGERFFEESNLVPEASQELKWQFLASLGQSGELAAVERLSPRERECVGMSAMSCRRIAEELELSQRTVEHYLDSAKDKLGLESKAELVEHSKLWGELGLLEK